MIVDGKKITQVAPHYEQIAVWTSDKKKYFITYSELQNILSEFLFNAEKKKTRTWLHPVTPDVDLLYNQDQYPEDNDDD